ncbi:MAG: hypothetical protein QMD11_10265, partial [Smithella sp.]|nr:hypothetical protein [Smithella sp.]
HPYGMSLLYGNVSDEFLQSAVKNHLLDCNGRKKGEWLQIYPSDLEDKIDDVIGDKMRIFDSAQDQDNSGSAVVKHQRVNFKFNHRIFGQFRNKVNFNDYIFCNVDKYLFNETNGSVVPNNFWNNAFEFLKQGVGISLMVEGQAVAVAFSS